MEVLAQTYRVKPGMMDEYIRLHDNIWPEMLETLKKAGVKEIKIFTRNKQQLFLYAIVESIDKFKMASINDPIFLKWNKRMDDILDKPFDEYEGNIFADMKMVFQFENY